jgi:predicted  nucleic acid-binding Zn-ribbon protein
MKPKKKRNLQDATLRNVRALKKRVAELEKQVRILKIDVKGLRADLAL